MWWGEGQDAGVVINKSNQQMWNGELVWPSGKALGW